MTENEAIKAIQNDLEWHSKELKPTYKQCLRLAIQALEKVQQFEAIGTIEELKALKEKNTPKKVAYQVEHEKCPNCGSFHVFGKHCTECGQAVDYD